MDSMGSWEVRRQRLARTLVSGTCRILNSHFRQPALPVFGGRGTRYSGRTGEFNSVDREHFVTVLLGNTGFPKFIGGRSSMIVETEIQGSVFRQFSRTGFWES